MNAPARLIHYTNPSASTNFANFSTELLITQQYKCKILWKAYKAIHNSASSYITDL